MRKARDIRSFLTRVAFSRIAFGRNYDTPLRLANDFHLIFVPAADCIRYDFSTDTDIGKVPYVEIQSVRTSVCYGLEATRVVGSLDLSGQTTWQLQTRAACLFYVRSSDETEKRDVTAGPEPHESGNWPIGQSVLGLQE